MGDGTKASAAARRLMKYLASKNSRKVSSADRASVSDAENLRKKRMADYRRRYTERKKQREKERVNAAAAELSALAQGVGLRSKALVEKDALQEKEYNLLEELKRRRQKKEMVLLSIENDCCLACGDISMDVKLDGYCRECGTEKVDGRVYAPGVSPRQVASMRCRIIRKPIGGG